MNIDIESFFYLHSNTIPVKGVKRSTICDLERGVYDIIPNDLCDILLYYNKLRVKDLIKKYGNRNTTTLIEYFSFLVNREYIFLSKNKLNIEFEKKLIFQTPNKILNGIIDIDKNSKYFSRDIVTQFEELGCNYIQIRFFGIISKSKVFKILNCFNCSNIKHLQIIIDSKIYTEEQLYSLILKYPRIKLIIIYGSNVNISKNVYESKIYFTKNVISSSDDCGKINSNLFVCNIEFCSMSMNYNTCLYKKISIDKDGYIKNCPSMSIYFGKICNTTLEEALNHKYFKRLWNIKKSDISICKDCEFRHICSDCRVYRTNLQDVYSKPLKCKYDPYSAKWEK